MIFNNDNDNDNDNNSLIIIVRKIYMLIIIW